MDKSRFGFDQHVGKISQVICPTCKRATNHKVLKSVTHDWSTDDNDIQGTIDYLIIQCQGCETVSYCSKSTNSEDFDHETGEFEITRKQYPLVNINHTRIDLPWSTPKDIRTVYEETSNALSTGLTTLGAVGIRLIVELLCKAEGAIGDNLESKIESLRDQHLVSPQVADTIHGIRFFGNEVVHGSSAKYHELRTAWEVINVMLSYVYGSRDNQETLLTPEREKKLQESRRRRQAVPIKLDEIPF